MSTPREPTRILIAALGGEGGGVLVDWITRAAIEAGLHATRTSIPGVAQRTGATTYYVEVMPAQPGDPPPVLGLNAAPGRVDVFLGTELLEAARRAEGGFLTRDRTLALVAHRRAYTVTEKSEGGDGRMDEARLAQAVRETAREAVIADYDALARQTGAALNAVMLGVLAARGAVPIPPDAFRAAIRAGRAAESNLRGFEAGFAGASTPAADAAPAPGAGPGDLPGEARALAAEGVKRLTDFQDAALAEQYRATLRRFAALPGADGALVAALAKQLALRMSSEDVIRVAQLKLRDARRPRLVAEAKARPGDIVHVVEFMKPGPAEVLSLLPPGIARPALRFVERRGWMGKSIALNVSPTRPLGFLRLRLLAGLRGWRKRTLKHAEETAWIAAWLVLVERALPLGTRLAREVVDSARLVKGYAATDARTRANWRRIMEEVLRPALDGRLPPDLAADALLQARLAAQKDPEGDALDRTLAAIAARIASPSPRLAAD
ncbi:indolepyruvate oxidoreductase subunit B [Falsiroseomonas bella]|uniref:Indolepyruvate oxidoreductase subunit B n=1 Tax=Falsiroseomonas bella TaxID=2184016 RepID=A0A317FCK7_9PROT|nr:indolepyruvate oxidoreductase subunit beta family protein [Falsiroseomonas bella]PWS35747.1 indolepyruvate oxidoreductase subunit B [Falsiroseomonas bella]